MAASVWAGLACLQLINTFLLQQQTGVGLLSVVMLGTSVRWPLSPSSSQLHAKAAAADCQRFGWRRIV